MKGEINYWYEMATILLAAGRECKMPFVESVLQILQEAYPKDTAEFRRQRERIWAGMKEAKWNRKYMSTIDKPVDVITKGTFKEIAGVISSTMDSLKSIYEKSNFYKEARIVSFLDHMYQHVLSKMRKHFSIVEIMGSYDNFDETMQKIES